MLARGIINDSAETDLARVRYFRGDRVIDKLQAAEFDRRNSGGASGTSGHREYSCVWDLFISVIDTVSAQNCLV